jgi:soluble lytic murein transglycosylase-like protein
MPVVLTMLCVLVSGSYMVDSKINRHQELVSSPGEHPEAAPLIEAKKTSPVIASKIDGKLKYDQIVEDVARTYGLDSALLYAVIAVESGYNRKAVSKKGASGLMQLMPLIAKHYGVVDLLDPVQSLHGGAQYLRDMLILFNNDVMRPTSTSWIRHVLH